jgi:acyl carrier protein
VLAGRNLHAGDPALGQFLAEANDLGANVDCAALDVSDIAALHGFLSSYDGPSFAGVFHLAAVFEGGPIEMLSAGNLARVMRPKALGAWNLHTAFTNVDLDAFVLFSSLATLLGCYGQGAANYASANGFLNELAVARRASGKPALSINWGSWREIGRSSSSALTAHLATRGERTLDPTRAFEVMERLMTTELSAAVVADIDWQQLASIECGDADRALLRDLTGAGATPLDREGPRSRSFAAQTLPPTRDIRTIQMLLGRIVAEIVQAPLENIDYRMSLTDLGIDSLLLLELRGRIESELKLVIPIADLIDGASISSLSTILAFALGDSLHSERFGGDGRA